MSTIVIYKSKSGFTEKYAHLIGKELSIEVKRFEDIKASDINKYDTIIYGGGLYMSGINGLKLLLDKYVDYNKKNVVVFACGATPNRQSDINNVIDLNLTKEQQKHIKVFYMRGGFDFSKLLFKDKLLMLLLKLKLKSRKNPTADEKGMLASYSKPMDFTKERNIMPLVNYLRHNQQ